MLLWGEAPGGTAVGLGRVCSTGSRRGWGILTSIPVSGWGCRASGVQQEAFPPAPTRASGDRPLPATVMQGDRGGLVFRSNHKLFYFLSPFPQSPVISLITKTTSHFLNINITLKIQANSLFLLILILKLQQEYAWNFYLPKEDAAVPTKVERVSILLLRRVVLLKRKIHQLPFDMTFLWKDQMSTKLDRQNSVQSQMIFTA